MPRNAEVRLEGGVWLLLGESSRRLNLVIRLQQARFGRFSYHTNLLAGLGRAASG
jgi:hypothetical protein